jgi:hypothetical protein
VRLIPQVAGKAPGEALLELALIMFGILAALAVQSWWDERIEQAELRDYLVALEAEVRDNRRILEEQDAKSVAQLADIEKMFRTLAEAGQDQLPENFEADLGQLYKIWTVYVTNDTYKDLINSGILRSVASRRLRLALAQYERKLSRLDFYTDILWTDYNTNQLPFLTRHAMLSRFGWDTIDGDQAQNRVDGPYTSDLSAFRSREFWNLLYSVRSNNQDLLSGVRRAKSSCDELLELLRSEIR